MFVAVVFFVYWTCPASRLLRLAVVFTANYLFCARYGLFFILLIPFCSTLDFLVGLGLMRFHRVAVRRLLLGLSVSVNLAILVGHQADSRGIAQHLGPRDEPIGPRPAD